MAAERLSMRQLKEIPSRDSNTPHAPHDPHDDLPCHPGGLTWPALARGRSAECNYGAPRKARSNGIPPATDVMSLFSAAARRFSLPNRAAHVATWWRDWQ